MIVLDLPSPPVEDARFVYETKMELSPCVIGSGPEYPFPAPLAKTLTLTVSADILVAERHRNATPASRLAISFEVITLLFRTAAGYQRQVTTQLQREGSEYASALLRR